MNRAIMVNHLDSGGLPKESVLRFAFLNSYFKTDQKYPLDDAILAYVYTNGYRFQPSKWRKIDEIPFDFIRRRVSVILETESHTEDRNLQFLDRFMVTKGALEEVLKVSSFIEHVDSGAITNLSPEDYQRILSMAEDVSNEGLRTIGVATKRLKPVCLDLFSSLLSFKIFNFLKQYYNDPRKLSRLIIEALSNHI
jgi:Mg2+-importing ATPase